MLNSLNCSPRRGILLLISLTVIYIIILIVNSKNFHPTLWKLSPPINLESIDFSKLSANYSNLNKYGLNYYIVPNLVHLIIFDSPFISFITYLCIKAALKYQKPDQLIIHTNQPSFSGKYWFYLKNETTVKVSFLRKPETIFGRPLAHVYHASDIARLKILMTFGGIYIDTDMLILQSLDNWRRYECSIGWPVNENIGNQLIISNKNSRFIKLWFNSYRHYNGSGWYYNAGQLPTKSILNDNPDYIHRETSAFGVAPLINYLHQSNKPKEDWINQFVAIHLLDRHRSYLNPDGTINYFNEFNIKSYNRTFGAMARDVLYSTTNLM